MNSHHARLGNWNSAPPPRMAPLPIRFNMERHPELPLKNR
jgi:hypothetical protein